MGKHDIRYPDSSIYSLHKVILLILILISFLHAQELLPTEYKLFIEFKRNNDTELGERIVKEYPDAVFLDDLKLLLAKVFYTKGEEEKAKSYLLSINPRELKPDLKEEFKKLWQRLSLDPKQGFLKSPYLFSEWAGSVRVEDPQMRLQIATELFRHRKYRAVVEFLENNYLPEACHLLGSSYVRLGDLQKGISILQDCNRKESKETLLRVYYKQGDEQAVDRLVQEDAKLALLAGKLYMSDGHLQRAFEYLSLARHSFEGNFLRGLILYSMGRYREALNSFLEASNVAKDEEEYARASFWVYKTYKVLGEEDIALDYLRRSSEGTGFYSLVASMYLGKPLDFGVLRAVFADSELPKQALTVEAIKKAGFDYYARKEAVKRIDLMSPADIVYISKVDPFVAIWMAAKKYGANSDVFRAVAYPKAYREYVNYYSRKYNVDPNLVFAVIRQESLFDPYAVSAANAKGLMQLIEPTAKRMAKLLGLESFDLFEPRQNVQLGVFYLRYLLDLWKGDVIRAVASYNAGENTVAKWPNYTDPYLFIEMIPYAETRNYVKRVLQGYYIYSSFP